MAQLASQNLTIGKGIVWFAPHATQNPTAPANGFEDMGNAPGLSLSVSTETLPHHSSRGGIRQKDAEIILEVNRSGSLTIDDMKPSNLAKFFLGSASTVTHAGVTTQTNQFVDVKPGIGYQIGVSSTHPAGLRKLSNVVVHLTGTPATIYVLDTDYALDADRGFIEILPGGALASGTLDIDVDFDVAASTRPQVIAGNTEIGGSLLFQAFNPAGPRMDYLMPYVKIRPSGDLQLISEEFMQVEFTLEVLALGSYSPIYLNGQPV